MNYCNKLALASLVLVSSSLSAAEPAQGWYAGVLGDVSFAPSATFDFTRPLFGFDVPGKVHYDVGGGGGIQVGFRCNYFRFEGQALYNYSGYNELGIRGFTLNNNLNRPGLHIRGSTQTLAGLFNAYYEFYEDGTDPNFVPYVGLGVGYAGVKNQLRLYFDRVNLDRNHDTENNGAAIGQIILGVNYFLNDEWSFGTDFRYLATTKINALDGRVKIATLNFVVNYSFDEPG